MEETPKKSPAARWAPVLLSGLVYPGAGQLVQRRWLAAAFFILVTTGLFVWLLADMAKAMSAYLRYVADPYGVTPPVAELLHALIPFGVMLLVFGINLLDAALASRRKG